ncbi:MAG TPA: Ig-like domain-containing protein [Polyangiaceae bacterium]|nr:Ig-like domain-containing protein [Polyangiaceae bacterium]
MAWLVGLSVPPRRCASRARFGLALGALALAACSADVSAPPPGVDAAGGGGGPSGPLGTAGNAGRHEGAPLVAFSSPADGSTLAESRVLLRGSAQGDPAVASVFVKVGPNVAVAAASADGFRTWSLDAAVPVGAFEVSATAYDVRGRPSERPARLSLDRPSGAPDGAAPSVLIDSPADGSTPAQALALVRGRAADDRAVVRMEASRDGEPLAGREVETDDFFGTWSLLVPLVPGQSSEIVVAAFDAGGRRGEAKLRLVGPSTPDADAPALALTSPAAGEPVSAESVAVAGTAFDDDGVAEVKVRVGVPQGAPGAIAWGPYVKASTADGYATWSAELALPPGQAVVQARAADVNGLASVAERALTNDFKPAWSDEVVAPLRVRDEPRAELDVALDKAGLNTIINAELQKTLVLLELDPAPLLTNALGQIKNACGTAWKLDSPNPQHNCALTPLGQTFQGPDGNWQTSAEYSLVRVLTMTPANAVVEGTSVEGLQDIADGAILGIEIGGGFNQVLADTLGIARTTEIVGTPAVVAAMKSKWMASHPALSPTGGRIPVTMFDALNNLAPLGPKLGPAGGHPGVLDPASPPSGTVLTSSFKVVLKALSNLRWKDGVVLGAGKEYMAIVDDPDGQGAPVDFDFTSPTAFQIEGLASAPTVDLRVKVQENPAFVNSCVDQEGCKGNLPGSPFGAGSVWATPPWQLEHVVGFAARTQYASRSYAKCLINFLGCQAQIDVGQNGDPLGWTEFDIIFNLGDPPQDQYLWELINEVAQVALHRYSGITVPEGTANVAFTLQDVPVGLTAQQIRDAIRPSLQSQAATLADGVLGNYEQNNGPVDFFYDLGDDGKPYLYFVAPGDPRPSPAYGYERPGFYAAPSLAPETKLSRLNVPGSGDAAHEKLALAPGEATVYAEDQAGQVYRLRLLTDPGPAPQVRVAVAHRLAP